MVFEFEEGMMSHVVSFDDLVHGWRFVSVGRDRLVWLVFMVVDSSCGKDQRLHGVGSQPY